MTTSRVALFLCVLLFVTDIHSIRAAPTTSAVVWDNLPIVDPVGIGRSYNAGTKTLTICRNDSVLFYWQTGPHDLAATIPRKWLRCDVSGATNVIPLAPVGGATINYPIAGAKNYMCTVGGHCAGGQKLKVLVKPAPC